MENEQGNRNSLFDYKGVYSGWDLNFLEKPTVSTVTLYELINESIPNCLCKDIYISQESARIMRKKVKSVLEDKLDSLLGKLYQKRTFIQRPQHHLVSVMSGDNINSLEDSGFTTDIPSYNEKLIDNEYTTVFIYAFKAEDGFVNLICLSNTCTLCCCSSPAGDEIVSEIYQTFLDLEEEPEMKKKIMLVTKPEYGYSLVPMDVLLPEEFNIDELYPDDFKKVDAGIREFIESPKSGLVILHGMQGTGKTTYIRYIIHNYNKQFVFLPADMVSELTTPSFVNFLKDKLKDSVLIIEDCEGLLRDRSKQASTGTGISNILNMSDGLLGDSIKLKFICTFNSKYQDIDKALLRTGRLKQQYRFGELPTEKANRLLHKMHGEGANTDKPMTLADIFNFKSDNNAEQATNRNLIGYQ